MKGKFYRPEEVSQISKRIPTSNRPWKEKPLIPSVYIWKSSLPESLIKEQGEKAFKHISQTTRNKNTLDFLKRNQKYMRIIADSHRHTPSMRISLAQSRISTPHLVNRSKEKEDHQFSTLLSVFPQNSIENINSSLLTKSQSQQDFPDDFTLNTAKRLRIQTDLVKSVIEFEPDLPNYEREKFIVNRFSLPKLLVGTRKAGKSKINFKNQEVNNFINRFEKKDKVILTNKVRLGVNGWKLIRVKKKLIKASK